MLKQGSEQTILREASFSHNKNRILLAQSIAEEDDFDIAIPDQSGSSSAAPLNNYNLSNIEIPVFNVDQKDGGSTWSNNQSSGWNSKKRYPSQNSQIDVISEFDRDLGNIQRMAGDGYVQVYFTDEEQGKNIGLSGGGWVSRGTFLGGAVQTGPAGERAYAGVVFGERPLKESERERAERTDSAMEYLYESLSTAQGSIEKLARDNIQKDQRTFACRHIHRRLVGVLGQVVDRIAAGDSELTSEETRRIVFALKTSGVLESLASLAGDKAFRHEDVDAKFVVRDLSAILADSAEP